jgi:carboxyl-terminal processing protease
LLGEALFRITGTHVTREGRSARVLQEEASAELSSSISRKAGGSNMFYDR